jgi:hypothetical protein
MKSNAYVPSCGDIVLELGRIVAAAVALDENDEPKFTYRERDHQGWVRRILTEDIIRTTRELAKAHERAIENGQHTTSKRPTPASPEPARGPRLVKASAARPATTA